MGRSIVNDAGRCHSRCHARKVRCIGGLAVHPFRCCERLQTLCRATACARRAHRFGRGENEERTKIAACPSKGLALALALFVVVVVVVESNASGSEQSIENTVSFHRIGVHATRDRSGSNKYSSAPSG